MALSLSAMPPRMYSLPKDSSSSSTGRDSLGIVEYWGLISFSSVVCLVASSGKSSSKREVFGFRTFFEGFFSLVVVPDASSTPADSNSERCTALGDRFKRLAAPSMSLWIAKGSSEPSSCLFVLTYEALLSMGRPSLSSEIPKDRRLNGT